MVDIQSATVENRRGKKEKKERKKKKPQLQNIMSASVTEGGLRKKIKDATLAPTPKPEVEMWRKPNKRTVPLSMGESWVPI